VQGPAGFKCHTSNNASSYLHVSLRRRSGHSPHTCDIVNLLERLPIPPVRVLSLTQTRTTSPTSTQRQHDVAHVIRHQTFHHPGHTSNSVAQNSAPIQPKSNHNQAKHMLLSFPIVKSVALALYLPRAKKENKNRPFVCPNRTPQALGHNYHPNFSTATSIFLPSPAITAQEFLAIRLNSSGPEQTIPSLQRPASSADVNSSIVPRTRAATSGLPAVRVGGGVMTFKPNDASSSKRSCPSHDLWSAW
jgi:hypothetical protein